MAKLGKKDQKRKISQTEANRRKTLALARLRELELAEKQGKLIDRKTHVDQYSKMVIAARTRFLEIPSKLAPQVSVESDPVVCQALMDQAITEALEELGNYGSKTPA